MGMTPNEELASIRTQIEALEARQAAIYRASVEAPADQKVCDDRLAEMLGEEPRPRFKFPVELHGITYSGELIERGRVESGAWVKVRPSDEASKGKTFLGVYLGDIALSIGCSHDRATGILEVRRGMHNPAVWVPDLKRIVFGCGSWWGRIKSPDDLRQITDTDISSVWYVQAMKALGGDPDTRSTAAPQAGDQDLAAERRAIAIALRGGSGCNGGLIRRARLALRLLQSELADVIMCSPETLSRWETGARAMPRAEQLALVALMEETTTPQAGDDAEIV